MRLKLSPYCGELGALPETEKWEKVTPTPVTHQLTVKIKLVM